MAWPFGSGLGSPVAGFIRDPLLRGVGKFNGIVPSFASVSPQSINPVVTSPPPVSGTLIQSADWIGTTSLPANLTLSRSSSGTYFDSFGVLQTASSNTPRFDNKWNGTSWVPAGLLIEEQRTNDLDTNNVSSGSWSYTTSSTIGSLVSGPAGAGTAYPITPNTTGGVNHLVGHPATVSSIGAGNPLTLSIFVKPNGYTQVYLRARAAGVVFNLTGAGSIAGTFDAISSFTTITGAIQQLDNGWFRIAFTGISSGATSYDYAFGITDGGWVSGDAAVYNYAGDGTSGVIVFAPQSEAGPNASSYIYTTGTVATRSADIPSTTDVSLVTAKAWVVEVGELIPSTQATLLGINTAIGIGATTGNALQTTDGGTQTSGNTGTWSGINRGGIAFDATPRVSIDLNGSTVVTAANTPVTPTTIYFGNTNAGASDFLNGHIRSWGAFYSLTDADLVTFSTVGAAYAPSADASVSVAQTLGGLVQTATDTVLAQATIAQTLGALSQVVALTHPDTADTTQTLGALGQTVALTAFDPLVAAQTLGALAQVAAATAPDAILVAQNLGALVQSAAATHPDTAAVAQTLGALVQTATGGVIDQATAAQTLGALAQAATASAPAGLTAAQTIGVLGQTTAATAPLAIAAAQTLGVLAQSAAATHPDTAAVVQALGALSQTATAGVVDNASVNQALGDLVQAATATIAVVRNIDATQTLGALAQALTGTVVDTATVAQNLGALGQSVAAAHADTASVAQTLGAITQALTGTVIDAATVNQALGALNQTATTTTASGFFAAQTLGSLVQALTGKAIDTATVAQALGGLTQTTTGGPVDRIPAYTDTLPALSQASTAGHFSFANVAQVLGALSQVATGGAPAAAATAQILGALQQVAASTHPDSVLANQVLGALGQSARLALKPTATVFIKGTLDKPTHLTMGTLTKRGVVSGSLKSRAAIHGALR